MADLRYTFLKCTCRNFDRIGLCLHKSRLTYVSARSRGPQFVTFMSDDKIGDDETLKELGFSMNYEFIDDSC